MVLRSLLEPRSLIFKYLPLKFSFKSRKKILDSTCSIHKDMSGCLRQSLDSVTGSPATTTLLKGQQKANNHKCLQMHFRMQANSTVVC